MQIWLRTLLAAAFTIGWISIALAEKRVALIVANGDYKGAELQNPIFDADLVAASLRGIGFTVTVVKNADLGAFDHAVNGFVADGQDADVALFYFAGHGFTVNEGIRPVSMLMSTSADITSNSERVLKYGGIALDDIVGSLVGKARATLVFVDACRNDPRVGRAVGGHGRGFVVLETVRGGSVFIGLSTRLGETAQDGVAGMGSPFARAFADKIKAPGMRIDDVFRALRDEVKSETGGEQLPDIVQDDLPGGAITLVDLPPEQLPRGDAGLPLPPAAAPVDTRLAEAAQVWATLQDSNEVDTLALFKKRYEGTFYAELAALRLKQISDTVTSLGRRHDAGGPMGIAPFGDCDRFAASPFDPKRPTEIAGVAFNRINSGQAVPACRAALEANPNDTRILFQLARALQRAGGAEPEALELYRRAVEGGHVEAMNSLASVYARGEGAAKEEAEAVRLYRKAADAGSLAAMNNLGNMYFYGRGVSKDDAEAARWYRQAADKGLALAMSNLGGMYANGTGVDKNEAEAVRLARKAAEAGDAHGMSGLGVMYENGEGVTKDPAQALSWYQQAAAMGDEYAKSAVKRISPQSATSP
jgi:hypothetical protein